MSHFRVVLCRSSAGLVALLLLCGTKHAQLRAQAAEEAQNKDTRRALRMGQMRQLAQAVKVLRITDQGDVPAEPLRGPLLRMSDTSRGIVDGSIWMWGQKGRPDVVLQLWTHDPREAIWGYAFSSLSTNRVTAQGDGNWKWAPTRPGLQPKPFPKGPTPATEKRARMRQIKALARRFGAYQFWDPGNQRSELRVLPQPVHRYSDRESGLLDGAIFVIAHATDPEIFLLIEAVSQDTSPATWQYGLARLGHAEFHVKLDGKEVWQQHRVAEAAPDDPYFLFIRNAPRNQ